MTVDPERVDPVRVFLCEDDARLRRHLARSLESVDHLAVVGQAPTAEAAAEALSAARPDPGVDVLLLDLELPGMDGLALLAQLPPPPDGPEVLILTTYADADRVFEAMRRGAAGYLVKGVGRDRLAEAIGEVASGGTVIEPRLARRFWNLFEASRGHLPSAEGNAGTPGGAGGAGGAGTSGDAGDAGDAGLGLTEEEVEVLGLVARGLTNPEVGSVLGTSRRRVKRHLEAVYRKLGVSGRVEAVIRVTAAGLIEL